MGKFNKGILGGFSGTVGTVVGGTWRGIDYMRSRPQVKSGKTSEAQTVQRAKFALVTRFIRLLGDLFNRTFKESASRMTGRNSALGYLIKNAITGVFPQLELDYSQTLVSRGSLANAPGAQASSPAAGEVRFQWTDNSGSGSAKATDKAVIVAYCPELDQVAYSDSTALRPAVMDSLQVPAFSGKKVQTWLSFLTENGKDSATSQYTGEVMVA